MKRNVKRRSLWWLTLLAGAVFAAGVATALGLFATTGSAPAQVPRERSSMEQRLAQIIEIINTSDDCPAVRQAIDSGLEILYGGLRPLPSKGEALEQTIAADRAISDAEMQFAAVLGRYAQRGACPELQDRALDLKLFVEQMNEVAFAVGNVTAKCGEGDTLRQPPCDELHALLDEKTGEELSPGSHIQVIRRSYSVKLRSPFVPPFLGRYQHDVRLTEPLAKGECATVFKETRGLTLRLHLQRIIVVTDPWEGTFGVPRGTRVAIWRLEWVPTQYGKTWSFCNIGGSVRTSVTQRVKQDIPVNFFWRFYPKDP